jgi:uncharacterized membrane protein
MEWGWRVYGLGIVAVSLVAFAFSGQPVPKWLPERAVFAYAAAAFLLVAGLGMELRRTVTWAAAALIVYYVLFVLLLENGPAIVGSYDSYGTYFAVAEPLSFAAAALIVYAATSDMDATRAARLTRLAQLAFGACAVFFGGAHFVYLDLTAPLIPTWLPPSQEAWAYATGVFHIAAGIALLTGIQARLAAILAAVMYASFIPLVFVPVLMKQPASAFRWTELATTIVLIGVAWTIADSLKPRA